MTLMIGNLSVDALHGGVVVMIVGSPSTKALQRWRMLKERTR